MAIKNKPLVSSYGTLWARNAQNIRHLRAQGKLYGVYVLRWLRCRSILVVAGLSEGLRAIGAARVEGSFGTTFPGLPSRIGGLNRMWKPYYSECFRSISGASISNARNLQMPTA